MAARKPAPRRKLRERTPIAEWTAAGLGLVLTLGAIGYSAWEGLTAGDGPPRLSVEAGAPEPSAPGFVVPLTVKNDSHATAAAVEVTGELEQGGQVVETRRVVLAYVPGKGETRGGLLFERDPRGGGLRVRAEGYEEP